MLSGHRKALDKIADYLIRKETITGKEFMKIFRAVEKGMDVPENLDELDLNQLEDKELAQAETDKEESQIAEKSVQAETDKEESQILEVSAQTEPTEE